MWKKAEEVLKKGGIAVFPTDTIYGMHTPALKKDCVERLYKLRKRNPKKPFIILIPSITALKLFGIKLSKKVTGYLEKIWPGKVSVVLPCKGEKFTFLHRGTYTLAFRVPDKKEVLSLLKKTGPLVSTSVNPEGKEPAKDIKEAKKYFGNNVDFYLDEGKISSLASTLIEIKKGKVVVIREGSTKVPQGI